MMIWPAIVCREEFSVAVKVEIDELMGFFDSLGFDTGVGRAPY